MTRAAITSAAVWLILASAFACADANETQTPPAAAIAPTETAKSAPVPTATPTPNPTITPATLPLAPPKTVSTPTPNLAITPAPNPTPTPATLQTETPTPSPTATPKPAASPEARPILIADVERSDREESVVTAAVSEDGARLGTVARTSGAAWSPDGARIAYVSRNGGEVRVADADGGGAWAALSADSQWYPMYQWPAWSPDGARLAAVNVAWCEVGMRVSSIEIIDADYGGSLARHGPYDFWQADGTQQGPTRFSTPNKISWSADGENLLVSWDKATVIDAESGKARALTSEPVLAEWAPGAGALYYFEIAPGETNRRNRTLGALYLRRLEWDEARLMLSAADVAALGLAVERSPIAGAVSLSPDGGSLAAAGGEALYIFDVSGGADSLSSENAARYEAAGGATALDWSPDGSALAALIADEDGVRLDILDISSGEWREAARSEIGLRRLEFMGKAISWAR